MRLESYLARVFKAGNLEVKLPGGPRLELGDGDGPRVGIAITDVLTLAKLAKRPALALGEAYMDGGLVIEQGEIYDLLELVGRNFRRRPDLRPPGRLRAWWIQQRRHANQRAAARRNVAHHYDLSVELYRKFLDEDLQYSCAYFADPDMSLDEAQLAKKRHIAAKLLLEPDQKVLDIGCGWGGLALTLAEETGAIVDGITLSTEQLATAKFRAEGKGLAGRANFSLTDYRDVQGTYDRIVSVGMFEHVGRPNYQAYFDQVARLLADDGVALIHSIGRMEGPGETQPWIAKYIFPGGYIPALSEVTPAIEKAGLFVTDVEILRLHYAETLRHWRARFAARRDEAAALYDERFCRMWEFYLAASEVAFRYAGHMVFQIQLTKRLDAVPLTRDYIGDTERALARPPASSARRRA